MEILKVNNLCKTYGESEVKVNALKNVSFSLEKGEFAAIVGESGSGKSTLLNCVGALDTPTSGTILMDGQNLFSMKEEERTIFRRRNIGFIFQSFQLVSELNVEQNIMFPLLLDYRKPDPKEVEEILNLLGLTERRYHLPSQLSGGQQQRVAIGRALITKPKLILADEPTGNLDSKNSQDVMDMLIKASRQYEQTILLITHNKNLTVSVDRVFQVSDGVLTDLGGNENENYLDLVPISAKVHRKQNRMSIFCIILAVFLITTIFGMADMFIRSQIIQAKIDNGDFHITVQGITDEEAGLIKKRPDVKAAARYGVLNFNDDKGYTISDKKSIIVGADEEFVTQLQMGVINEGNFPQNDNEAMITKNAGENLGLQVGDTVTIKRPGELQAFCLSDFRLL